MTPGQAYPVWRFKGAPGLPVTQMVVGKPVEDAAALLPRLFNLCRCAQGTAARGAFGLPLADNWLSELRAEIIREHVVKLCLKWPAALTKPGTALPKGWQDGTPATRSALFGPEARLPRSNAELTEFLEQDFGISPMLRAISQLFDPGIGCRNTLPLFTEMDTMSPGPLENSVAARQAHHPVMQFIAEMWGRGPLWSAFGVALDLEALWNGEMTAAHFENGYAAVPAARGLYIVKAETLDGIVSTFSRITPTDHLLATGGTLEQSLCSLKTPNAEPLASVLLSILDPCHPIELEAGPLTPAKAREDAHA